MDTPDTKLFKRIIVNAAFKSCPLYESSWIDQVLNISDYWDEMITEMDLWQLYQEFESDIKTKNVRRHKTFTQLLHDSKTTLKVELMTDTANRIAQFFTDETDGMFVRWNGNRIEFKHKLEPIKGNVS